MEELVFFNRGNALATNVDTKELYRTAQVDHVKYHPPGQLVIVLDEENGEHVLFDLSDQKTNDHEKDVKGYHVKEVIR
ncbi:hypothetical protein [Vagococcus humatus]|uniref:Uncharacterized protein n=1 Tax=Vagococcus humatus TaxID=1889241 RepID=A0A3R9YFP1_9ENTE|nr:hypothetical protein [Vagococcus humatus]RST90070.1 hypothetical protein C7P63_03045 [Vagococcus humatus]